MPDHLAVPTGLISEGLVFSSIFVKPIFSSLTYTFRNTFISDSSHTGNIPFFKALSDLPPKGNQWDKYRLLEDKATVRGGGRVQKPAAKEWRTGRSKERQAAGGDRRKAGGPGHTNVRQAHQTTNPQRCLRISDTIGNWKYPQLFCCFLIFPFSQALTRWTKFIKHLPCVEPSSSS